MAYQTYILVQWMEVIDGQLSPVRRFVCPTEDDKPSSGLKTGDEATVLSPPAKYTCYNGTSWTSEGGGGPHTHPESDITDLISHLAGKSFVDHDHDLYYEQLTRKGEANGYASLGADGKVPADQLPSSGGGNGYVLNGGAANQSTTTDAKTLYWGCFPGLAIQTASSITRMYIPKAGTIVAAQVFLYANTAGTAEAWVMNIRKNNSEDMQIASLSLSAKQRLWANYALNIAVAQGDYVEIKEVCPTWATNPANVRRACSIYIE